MAAPAGAASYDIPANMPPGCSGSNGSYSCPSGTLDSGDTVSISGSKPITVTVNGSLGVNGAKINQAGSASDLVLVVNGQLTPGYQGLINANVRAQSVSDSNGAASFGGSLQATSGAIVLGYRTAVTGAITGSGNVTLGDEGTAGSSITANGTVSTGYRSSVAGAISAGGNISTGQESTVGGAITATGVADIAIGYGATVNGAVRADGGQVSLAQSAVARACVQTAVSSKAIVLGWQTNASAVCCGALGSCSNSCVKNNSGGSTPALCSSAGTLVARYDFDEASYAGTAGEWKDTAGYSGGPFNGRAQGSPLPAAASASPARSGSPGSCGYATLGGASSGGAGFLVSGLPLSTSAGARSTVAFWMHWDGSDSVMALGFAKYDLIFLNGWLGFNTSNSDVYGISSSGLANGWHHVVAVFGNGGVTSNQLWIDGVAQTLAQRMGTPLNSFAVVGSTLQAGGWTNDNGYRFHGRIDQLRVYSGAVSNAQVATLYAETPSSCAPALHHLEIQHASGSGLTCTASTLTVRACQDAACSSLYTGGVSGSLSASGGSVAWPDGAGFSIAAGSSSGTVRIQPTTTTAALLGSASSTPAAANATSCNFGSPSCSFSAADAGLLFDVPHHRAEATQTVTVSAVRKADNSLACVPAFASVSKAVNFKCSYSNPASGSRAVRVGGQALNAGNNASAACDNTGRSLSLAFNASGQASTSVVYADVGLLGLSATYTGSGSDAGLVMSGSDSFIAAPTDFLVDGLPTATIAAGSDFAATVTARNAAGVATPNFGRETVAEGASLGFVRTQPTGTGAVTGSFSGSLGSFSNGAATGGNLRYAEVGQGQVSATLASGSYLGSGLGASGSSAAALFKPHHFDLAHTAACGSFSYAGQAFATSVTARNAAGATTRNYDGSSNTNPNFAKAVALAEPSALGLGTLSGSSVVATAFSAGVASTSPAYAFSSKTTAPQSLVLRASDADAVSSSGYAEPAMALRSGRLRLRNAFGQARAALQLPVVAEYWAGNTWQLNSADSCTSLAGASVALSNARGASGASSAAGSSAGALAISGGNGSITLAAPNPAGSSLSLDVALNLGSGTADQSCNSSHPASTGAAKAWLRAQNGSCAASADRDPAARASFGIFSPETRKTVHVRDLF